MKFRFAYLVGIAILHGHLLWTQSGIAPFWLKRADPPTEIEVSLRGILLPALIALSFFLNKLVLRETSTSEQMVLRSVAVGVAAYLPIQILSDFIDVAFFPEFNFGDQLTFYKTNPIFLIIQILVMIIAGAIAAGFLFWLSRLIQAVLRRITVAP